MEKAVCNKCKATYTDKGSIELAKRWIEEGYAPCPNISCRGELELITNNPKCPVKNCPLEQLCTKACYWWNEKDECDYSPEAEGELEKGTKREE